MRDAAYLNTSRLCTEYLSLFEKQSLNKRARVAEYAGLIGWTPERLVNRLLAERLDEFDEVGAGNAPVLLARRDMERPIVKSMALRCQWRSAGSSTLH
jgi:hypothetical protein